MEQPPPLRLLKVLGTNGCKPGQDFLNALHYNKLKICDYEIYFERGEKNLFCKLWIPVQKN